MTESKKTKAILVGVHLDGTSDQDYQDSFRELERLVDTLGFEVVGTLEQRRSRPHSASVVGKGKLEELARKTGGSGIIAKGAPEHKRKIDTPELPFEPLEEPIANQIVFDLELTPTQIRNLESATGVDVLDRTGVIVEIFHRHAKTRAAKLQIEIARLRYLSPRFRKAGDRQGGGIGAKGVGETAHELDKRRIRDRIAQLEAEIAELHHEASLRRSKRREETRVALVGYTNAGKSSLMRALTSSEVLVEDKLFATLDTTVRRMDERILVSDTVGFIKNLPHDLVASFRSTLDEAKEASLLLFVVDASDPAWLSQLQVTQTVLQEIDAEAPSFLVMNKADLLSAEEKLALKAVKPEAIFISTRQPEDVKALRARIQEFFAQNDEVLDVHLSYEDQGILAQLRGELRILAETHDEKGTTFRVSGPREVLKKLESKRSTANG